MNEQKVKKRTNGREKLNLYLGIATLNMNIPNKYFVYEVGKKKLIIQIRQPEFKLIRIQINLNQKSKWSKSKLSYIYHFLGYKNS